MSGDEGEIGTRDDRASSEAALVERLRRGDDAAYGQLVRDYGGRLFAVANRLLRNDDDARDAVQDGFIAAFRAIGRFEGGSQISTWLHRIVVNAALMKLRSRRRKLEESLDDLLPTFTEDGHHAQHNTEWSLSPLDAAERGDTRALVRECIDRLPETYRTVLLMRDIEELDTEETAKMLGITENAVKIRLHRARQSLRTLLDPHVRGNAI